MARHRASARFSTRHARTDQGARTEEAVDGRPHCRLRRGGRPDDGKGICGRSCGRQARDPALSFQLENDLVVLDVVPGYMHDTESRGFATVLEWLNPEYTSSVSLQASLQHAALEQAAAEAMRGTPRPRRVRIAAVQYLLRPIASFEDFEHQVEFFVRSAKDYKAHFLLFPEFFTMQLLSYIKEPAPAMAVRRLARMAPEYEALFTRLAKETGSTSLAEHIPSSNAARSSTRRTCLRRMDRSSGRRKFT
jgi:response regulator of citrate/malate metabolism